MQRQFFDIQQTIKAKRSQILSTNCYIKLYEIITNLLQQFVQGTGLLWNLPHLND